MENLKITSSITINRKELEKLIKEILQREKGVQAKSVEFNTTRRTGGEGWGEYDYCEFTGITVTFEGEL